LTPEEQRAWRAHLAAVRTLLEAVDAQLQRDAGLSHADYEILVRLSEAPERRLRMSALAEALRFSRSRTSHAVARLERAGWVLRDAYRDDGRGTVAILTDHGWETLVAAAPGHVRAVREHLVDRLTPSQLQQLEAISAAVCAPGHP
jgi:DNA-binding MarR family transcriptional regulator